MTSSNQSSSHHINGSHYGFSATRIEILGATEYTLVAIAADVSGSVAAFEQEIENCIQQIVHACRHSPRADNLMLRTVSFDNHLEEIHGYKPLTECPPDSYRGCLRAGGMTALYDAAHNVVESATLYGKDLSDNDFDVNAIVFVITDGLDNDSSQTARQVKQALARAVRSEALESVISVLVGVNIQDKQISQQLQAFRKAAGFTQYVELQQANAQTLAKLADFVSRSISAQSQALGTGGASQSLTF